MLQRPTATLRLEPHMLPGLIAAYDRAAIEMATLLDEVRRRARLPEPWAADVVSRAMFDHYNEQVVDDPHSTYAALRHYEQELLNIRDTLRRMDARYHRTEHEVEAMMKQRP